MTADTAQNTLLLNYPLSQALQMSPEPDLKVFPTMNACPRTARDSGIPPGYIVHLASVPSSGWPAVHSLSIGKFKSKDTARTTTPLPRLIDNFLTFLINSISALLLGGDLASLALSLAPLQQATSIYQEHFDTMKLNPFICSFSTGIQSLRCRIPTASGSYTAGHCTSVTQQQQWKG